MRASDRGGIGIPGRWTTACAVAAFLAGAAVRLPALGWRSLGSVEQTAFAESRGFDSGAELPNGEPVAADSLRRVARPGAGAAEAPPLYTAALAGWTRLAGSSESSLRLPSALAGALTVALAAVVGAQVAGPSAAVWAGLLIALSPIQVLQSREASPAAVLLLCLVASLAVLLRLDAGAGRGAAATHGLLLGVLGASGLAGVAALAALQLVWLAWKRERRPAAALSSLAAVLAMAVAGALGLFRSPLAPIDAPGWVPPTTLSGLARCAGASFTRVAGLEYHLVVPHARHVAPLTLGVVALVALGALRTPLRPRCLLLAGTALPFALGAALALSTGRVTPLQAARLVYALPFLVSLAGAGIASLPARTARLAGAAAAAGLGFFLVLALTTPSGESSPRHVTAEAVRRCLPAGATVTVQRPLDAVALAAWGVPGPFVLRAPRDPASADPTLLVTPALACAAGGTPACPPIPPCAAE